MFLVQCSATGVLQDHIRCAAEYLLSFLANKQKCFLSFCKSTSYPQQIIVGFWPEDFFFSYLEITCIMARIGGFWTEDLYFFCFLFVDNLYNGRNQWFLDCRPFFFQEINIVFFSFFVLSRTLSVTVCHQIQQALLVFRKLLTVSKHCYSCINTANGVTNKATTQVQSLTNLVGFVVSVKTFLIKLILAIHLFLVCYSKDVFSRQCLFAQLPQ